MLRSSRYQVRHKRSFKLKSHPATTAEAFWFNCSRKQNSLEAKPLGCEHLVGVTRFELVTSSVSAPCRSANRRFPVNQSSRFMHPERPIGPSISTFLIPCDSRQAVRYGESKPILDSVWTADIIHLDRHSGAGHSGNLLERKPARAKQGALADMLLPDRQKRLEHRNQIVRSDLSPSRDPHHGGHQKGADRAGRRRRLKSRAHCVHVGLR